MGARTPSPFVDLALFDPCRHHVDEYQSERRDDWRAGGNAAALLKILQDAVGKAQSALALAIFHAKRGDYKPQSAIWALNKDTPWDGGKDKLYNVPWAPVTTANVRRATGGAVEVSSSRRRVRAEIRQARPSLFMQRFINDPELLSSTTRCGVCEGSTEIWSRTSCAARLCRPTETVDMILDHNFVEMRPIAGDKVAALVNSFGGMPLMELYILYRRVGAAASAPKASRST